MPTFCAAVTETNDVGVVAEQCPHCDRLTPCLLRTVSQGNYICFVRISELLRESSCMCTECLQPFAGKPYWSYAEVVSIRDARGMELDTLLTKTNPILADRSRFKDQIESLGGDEHFAVSYQNVEGMRPGGMRSKLSRDLLDWPRLNETQRDGLRQQIGALFRAWQFARQMAVGFPTSSGALTFFLSAPVFGAILIWMLVTRSWFWGGAVLALIVLAATVLESILFKQAVSRWTRNVLVPGAEDVDIRLDDFVTVVHDITGSGVGLSEGLWAMRNHLPDIRQALVAAGKLRAAPTE